MRLEVFEENFSGPSGPSGLIKAQNLEDVFTAQTRSAESSELDSDIPWRGTVISITVGIDSRHDD
jgi:hypothetical protein